jgi:hypothetical protein
MAYINARKINRAIRDGLWRCEQATDILAEIETFLLILKARDGWREAELREVEAGIRRVLYGILDGATYSGDAKRRPADETAPGGPRPKVSGA